MSSPSMRARDVAIILFVILVTASSTGCTSLSKNRTTTPSPTQNPTGGAVSPASPSAPPVVQTPVPMLTPSPTPKPYFGKHHPGEVIANNMNNTNGMIVIEKSLNGSYYRMNPIHMEDATTGIYTTKYNPQWYSAQSADGSYPAVIGHVNPGYIPVSEVPTTKKP